MSQPENKHKTFYASIKDDLRNTHAYSSFLKESKAVKEFYLTEEQRDQLKKMKRVKGSFYVSGWVLKAMFYKLTPIRRILFVIGTLLLVNINIDTSSAGFGINGNGFFGGLCLIIVILLELKDKLLAHDELEAGKRIQESLMPDRMPDVKGWKLWLFTRSANEVCGDLIDFLPLDSGKFSIIMADVAGKGLHAALITAKLQATIRSLAGEIRFLPDLIGRINSIVHRDSPSHIFSSLLYAECNEKEGSIRFVNAGHFPALVIRGTTIEESAKGEAALGLIPNMKFTEHDVSLTVGDRFVLYSDGLTEAMNERGEFFGKDRLLSILSAKKGTPQSIGFEILRSIDAFIGSSTPSDDLSIIILQREIS